MCFSATASFVAGAALSTTGVVTIRKTKTKKEMLFAAFPLLFGVQQFIEGTVWLSFQYGLSFINSIATYSFVFFAYVLWPILVPFSVGVLEHDIHRKKILYVFQFIGTVVGIYLAYFIISSGVASQIVNKSIVYSMPEKYGVLVVGMYLMATCFSFLFSSNKIINLFGVFVGVSFAVTYYYYTASYVSVWCFFLAILSFVVYLYFRERGDNITK